MMMLAPRVPATITAVGRKRIVASMPNALTFRAVRVRNCYNHHPSLKGMSRLRSRSVPFSSSSTQRSSPSPPSFLGWLWGKYTEILIAKPLLVKGGSASLIFLASDSATQKLVDPTAEWDGNRALSGAGFGVAATLWLHYWWGFLEIVVNKRIPTGAYGQNKLVNALAKVIADQLVGAPLYIYAYYCTTHFGKEWMKLSNSNNNNNNNNNNNSSTGGNGESGEETKNENETTDSTTLSLAVSKMGETSDRALTMLPDTLLRHWTVWPIVHTFNFYYNPIHHRVLVQNAVLIFWSGYLSHLNNGGFDNMELVTPEKEVELTVTKRRETSNKHEPLAAVVVASAPNQDAPLATSGRTH